MKLKNGISNIKETVNAKYVDMMEKIILMPYHFIMIKIIKNIK
jgi:hypothetical protein